MVNDDPYNIKGSNYKEVIKEPSGKIHLPQGKNVKMTVPKGSKVYPNYDEFNDEFNRVLNSNNVFPFRDSITRPDLPLVIDKGINANDMDRIIGKHFNKHFSSIKSNNIIFDENGIKKWMSNGSGKTFIHNNQVEFKGLSV